MRIELRKKEISGGLEGSRRSVRRMKGMSTCESLGGMPYEVDGKRLVRWMYTTIQQLRESGCSRM